MIAFFVGMGYRNLQKQFLSVNDEIISETLFVTNVENLAADTYRFTLDYVLHNSEEARLNILSILEQLDIIVEMNQPADGLDGEETGLEEQQFFAAVSQFRFAVGNIIKVKENGASIEDILVMDQIVGLPALLSLQESASVIIANNNTALEVVKADFNSTYHTGLSSIIISICVITFSGLLAAILTTGSIIKPLDKLRKGTEMIAKGDLDYKVGTQAKDEIGQLSRAFDQMTEGLKTTMTSVDNLNTEIDERKKVEEALRSSEEKFRVLFENARDAIFLADAETGIIIDVNPAGCELIGRPKDKVIGMHQSKLHPEDKAEEYKALFREHVANVEAWREDMLVQRADGAQVPVEMSANLVELNGRPTMQGVFRDITGRKKAQQAIRESEEKFSKAFRSSPHPMYISTVKEGRFIDVNDSFTRVMGYKREEVIGKTSQELNLWLNQKDRSRILRKLAKEGRVVNEEFLHRVKSGEVHNMLFSAEPIKILDEDCLIAITTDITDRRKAEEDLRSSQEYSSSLLENSPHQIMVINPDMSIRYVNPKFEEVNGWTLDEVVGIKPPYPWWTEDMKTEETIEQFKEALDMDISNAEVMARKKNGELYWLELSWVGVKRDGELQYCLVNSIDITERKEMEETLKIREERFSDIADNAMEWIWEIDADGKYTYSSPVIEKILGYTSEEMMGTYFYDTLHADDREKLKKTGFRALTRKRPFHDFENRHVHKNKKIVWLSTSGVPILDAEDNLIGYRGVDTDITERKKREQLQQDENYVLTLLGQGAELTEVLDAIIHLAEENDSSITGSILLYDPEKNWLFLGSGPNLPADYLELLKGGVPVGENMGSCGTSAHRRERITAPDIANSPLFQPFENAIKFTVGNDMLASWAQPILSSDGDLLGIIAYFSSKIGDPDVEKINLLEWSAHIAGIAIERKRDEAALQESEEKFSKAFRSSPNTIAITTFKEGRFIEVNDSFTDITGYTREEAIGHSVKDLRIWAKLTDRKKMLAILKKDGRVHNEEFQFREKSGDIRTWLFSAEMLDIGNEKCMISMTVDITELKRAEKALKESEEFSSSLMRNSAVPILVVNEDNSMRYVNPSFEKLTGFSTDEVIGRKAPRPWWIDDKNSGNLEELIQITNENIRGLEKHFRKKNGERFWVEITSASVKRDGKFEYSISNWLDITDRKKMEDELRAHRDNLEEMVRERTLELTEVNKRLQYELTEREKAEIALLAAKNEAETANQAKSEFLARTSHEIRTPIHGVMGTINLVMDSKLEPDQRQYLTLAMTSAESLLNMINDILDLSKIEAGQMEPESEGFDLRTTIEETLDSLAVSAYKKDIELNYHLVNGIPTDLIGDPRYLRQVLTNLVGNAIKFTEKGEISVLVEATSGNKKETELHFSVRDTGIGIAKNKREMIFDPFQQADGSINRQYGGTGLGLTISRHLVRQMGGDIWVESNNGHGSTFHFTGKFTRQAVGKRSRNGSRDSAKIKGLPVLLVEDNATSRLIVKEMLEKWGCRVTDVNSGPEAFDAIKRAKTRSIKYKVILLDKTITNMDGFTIARFMLGNSTKPSDIIMMLPPHSVSDDLPQCQKLGISNYVIKPVKQSELLRAIILALGIAPESPESKEKVVEYKEQTLPSLRILVAEDNPTSQLIAKKTLEKLGHNVTVANNGLEAVNMYKEGEYDLIMMDAEMPVLNGLEAARRIREAESGTGKHIPIIAMTAYAMEEDKNRCLKAGMDNYLSKPAKPGEINAVISGLFNVEEKPAGKTESGEAVKSDSTPAVDIVAARRIFGDDDDLLYEAVDLFLNEDYPEQLKNLRNAIDTQDAAAVRSTAHSIKGASRSLGGMALGDAAFRLEEMGRDENLAEARGMLRMIEVEIERFNEYYSELENKPAGKPVS
jgi:PAS domain S-box-containing protein